MGIHVILGVLVLGDRQLFWSKIEGLKPVDLRLNYPYLIAWLIMSLSAGLMGFTGF